MRTPPRPPGPQTIVDQARRARRRGARRIAPAQDVAARVAAVAARLRQDGMKHSDVRDAVLEEFFKAGHHLSVDGLLARVRARIPDTGYTTVYRTLRLLVQQGLALERDFGGTHTLFEPADTPHHDHAICSQCGEVMEFEDSDLEALQSRVARRLGFEVVSHRLEIYGRCRRCAADAAHRRRAPPPRARR